MSTEATSTTRYFKVEVTRTQSSVVYLAVDDPNKALPASINKAAMHGKDRPMNALHSAAISAIEDLSSSDWSDDSDYSIDGPFEEIDEAEAKEYDCKELDLKGFPPRQVKGQLPLVTEEKTEGTGGPK